MPTLHFLLWRDLRNEATLLLVLLSVKGQNLLLRAPLDMILYPILEQQFQKLEVQNYSYLKTVNWAREMT